MKHYQYTGISPQGQYLSGDIYATNKNTARKNLIEQKISPRKIQRRLHFKSQTIPTKIIHQCLQQLSDLLNSKIHLDQCLTILISNTHHRRLKQLLIALSNEIKNGSTLSQSLEKRPHYFNSTCRKIITAGESSGNLPEAMTALVKLQNQQQHYKEKIQRACFYPILILFFATLVSLGIIFFIVPKFALIYANYNAKLPWMTRWVIHGSALAKYIVPPTAALLIVLVHYLRHHPHRQNSIPFLSTLQRLHQTLQWLCILNLSTQAKLNILDALALTHSPPALIQAVAAGQPLSQSVKTWLAFDAHVSQLLQIGEHSGQLLPQLDHLERHYQQRLHQLLDYTSKLLEPVLLAFLAGGIGFLVIAMYLPMLHLGKVV